MDRYCYICCDCILCMWGLWTDRNASQNCGVHPERSQPTCYKVQIYIYLDFDLFAPSSLYHVVTEK